MSQSTTSDQPRSLIACLNFAANLLLTEFIWLLTLFWIQLILFLWKKSQKICQREFVLIFFKPFKYVLGIFEIYYFDLGCFIVTMNTNIAGNPAETDFFFNFKQDGNYVIHLK